MGLVGLLPVFARFMGILLFWTFGFFLVLFIATSIPTLYLIIGCMLCWFGYIWHETFKPVAAK